MSIMSFTVIVLHRFRTQTVGGVPDTRSTRPQDRVSHVREGTGSGWEHGVRTGSLRRDWDLVRVSSAPRRPSQEGSRRSPKKRHWKGSRAADIQKRTVPDVSESDHEPVRRREQEEDRDVLRRGEVPVPSYGSRSADVVRTGVGSSGRAPDSGKG